MCNGTFKCSQIRLPKHCLQYRLSLECSHILLPQDSSLQYLLQFPCKQIRNRLPLLQCWQMPFKLPWTHPLHVLQDFFSVACKQELFLPREVTPFFFTSSFSKIEKIFCEMQRNQKNHEKQECQTYRRGKGGEKHNFGWLRIWIVISSLVYRFRFLTGHWSIVVGFKSSICSTYPIFRWW